MKNNDMSEGEELLQQMENEHNRKLEIRKLEHEHEMLELKESLKNGNRHDCMSGNESWKFSRLKRELRQRVREINLAESPDNVRAEISRILEKALSALR